MMTANAVANVRKSAVKVSERLFNIEDGHMEDGNWRRIDGSRVTVA